MGIKTTDRNLERTIIKLICAGGKLGKKVLAQVDESYFGNGYNKIAYKRILRVLKKKNEVISWRALCHDSALPDAVREALSKHKAKITVNKQVAGELVDQMVVYRRRRMMDSLARHINETQLKEGYDDEKLLEEVTQRITETRHKRTIEKPLVFGKNSNYKDVMENVLAGNALKVIPTGFGAWDAENGGLAAKTVTFITGFTGSMKTTLAEVLSCNLADRGARVGQMSLEMSQEETLILRAARAARIDRTEILLARNLTPKQQDKIRVALYKRNKHWKNVGGCVETHTPSQGITSKELFLTMEPYDYDVLVVDYVSLVDDMMDGDKFWMNLMNFTKQAKLFANRTNTRVVLLLQATEDNKIKLSTNMKNDADLIWSIKFDEDFRDSEFMDVLTPKARKQKAMDWPMKKSGSFADIWDCTDEEMQQFRNDKKMNKVDVKEKKAKKDYEKVDGVQTRGKSDRRQREEAEFEEIFGEAAIE